MCSSGASRNVDGRNGWPAWGGVVVFLVVIVFWSVLGWWVPARMLGRPDSADEAGAMFGAVEALFTGLAFAGLLIELNLQRQELALQRQDLFETRKELARAASAQEHTEQFMAEQVEVARVSARAAAAAQLYAYYSAQYKLKAPCFPEEEQAVVDLIRSRRDDTFACLEEAFAALRTTSSAGAGAGAVSASMLPSDHQSIPASADGS